MKSKFSLAVVVGITALLALGAVAYAAAADTDTTFKMKAKSPTTVEYSGKVTSDPSSAKCVKGRRVNVIHRGVRIASATTDADGKWKVIGPRPPAGDDVTAKVKKKRKNGKVVCRGTEVTKEFKP